MLRVKDSLTAFLIVISILHEIQEYTCFRIRDFNVPATVVSGSPVFLRCQFDLEKDKLVNLKWYFNDKEFLRFEPKSKREETQIFHLPALNLEKSNVVNSADKGSWIRLSPVSREMSGRYRCEVTIESLFFTMTKEGHMNVVPPTTTTSTESYPPVYHHRPSKQLDVDAIEEEPPSAEVLNTNNGSSTLAWPKVLYITLIVYVLLVVHWPV